MCSLMNNLTSASQVKHATASGFRTDDHSTRSDTESEPCRHKRSGRNLIVCIDGTSNQFGKKNTNVIEMYNLILKEVGDKQRTWYNSGIGTYARPSWKSFKYYRQALYHKIDLAIAWYFERTILAAYRWLSDNYEPGDCIFLFGFSRGAFQVRVLSAMIDKVGLIHKGNEMQIPFAYELYADPSSDERTVTGVGSRQEMSMAERFKRAFSYKNVRVHFVGAWDTVSSIGIARGTKMLPRTIDGMKHVCYFRHALALDERRVKFLPEYAYGGSAKPPAESDDKRPSTSNHGPSEENSNPSTCKEDGETNKDTPPDNIPPPKDDDLVDSSQVKKSTVKDPHTLEVWFAGTHSDIGGGNTENAGMDRSRPPLRWMVFQATALGLRTERFQRELSFKEQIEIKESLTGAWKLLEVVPFNRLTYTRRENGSLTSRKPHLGSCRKIHDGQKIHSSLLFADTLSSSYTPKARPSDTANLDGSFWKNLGQPQLSHWVETDLYQYTRTLVNALLSEPNYTVVSQNLRQTATSADGREAVFESLYEAVIRRLKNPPPELKIKYETLHRTVDIMRECSKGDTHLILRHSSEIRPLVTDLLRSNTSEYQEIARQFLEQFTGHSPLLLEGHTKYVRFVAFSPDGRRVVSGSDDMTVRIWDAETGKPVGEPFPGHTRKVWSVVFSPDGSRVVSGSADQTVRIWDAKTGKPVGEPFGGHTGVVRAVAFSPKGGRVVSGSQDTTIRIWNAKTGKPVGEPFQGHSQIVTSVAFSPDGRHVVSGSDDTTVRIWDAGTGKQVGETFRGHTKVVTSVAFSPDGRQVVSGSWDKTVRILYAETGKQAGEPFRGSMNEVWSVGFSPDGSRVVSGSWDYMVRIWDVETRKQVGEPLRGHKASVLSVRFSPDGSCVVSGSEDNTVRIWDVEKRGR